MEIPIFSLSFIFFIGFIFLKSMKHLHSVPKEEKVIFSLCLGLCLCLFCVLGFLALQKLF